MTLIVPAPLDPSKVGKWTYVCDGLHCLWKGRINDLRLRRGVFACPKCNKPQKATRWMEKWAGMQ